MKKMTMKQMEDVNGGDLCSTLFGITVMSCGLAMLVACALGMGGHLSLCPD